MFGYPERAMKIADERDHHARRLGHPIDLGFALTVGGMVFDHLGLPDEMLKRADEAERLGCGSSLSLVPTHRGAVLNRKGQFAEGTALLKASRRPGGNKAGAAAALDAVSCGFLAHLRQTV
jgi:hypothetical protein